MHKVKQETLQLHRVRSRLPEVTARTYTANLFRVAGHWHDMDIGKLEWWYHQPQCVRTPLSSGALELGDQKYSTAEEKNIKGFVRLNAGGSGRSDVQTSRCS